MEAMISLVASTIAGRIPFPGALTITEIDLLNIRSGCYKAICWNDWYKQHPRKQSDGQNYSQVVWKLWLIVNGYALQINRLNLCNTWIFSIWKILNPENMNTNVAKYYYLRSMTHLIAPLIDFVTVSAYHPTKRNMSSSRAWEPSSRMYFVTRRDFQLSRVKFQFAIKTLITVSAAARQNKNTFKTVFKLVLMGILVQFVLHVMVSAFYNMLLSYAS